VTQLTDRLWQIDLRRAKRGGRQENSLNFAVSKYD